MRLRAGDTLGGCPVLDVRALLRRWHACEDPVRVIVGETGLGRASARALLWALLDEHLIEQKNAGGGRRPQFERTVRGNAFAQASAAAALHRSTAERRLRELVQRMVHVNDCAEFLVGVEAAYVYGSYLTDAERLGDLDVSITLWRKESDPQRFCRLSDDAARASGRRFDSYVDFLFWPERQLLLFLKQRSRAYSLHIDEPLLKEDLSIRQRAILLQRRPVTPKPAG